MLRVYRFACLLLWLGVGDSHAAPGDEVTFRFQSNFWVNLHHFVRAEARRRGSGSPVLLPVSNLNQNERIVWNSALDVYGELAKASLIFNERLVRINNALAAAEDRPTLPLGVAEPEIRSALNSAAPIYRAHLWEQHRRDNERWIREFSPIVQRHAASVTSALAAAYHVRWPAGPIVVDLASESGPNLAYTTDGPAAAAAHTVIAPLKAA